MQEPKNAGMQERKNARTKNARMRERKIATVQERKNARDPKLKNPRVQESNNATWCLHFGSLRFWHSSTHTGTSDPRTPEEPPYWHHSSWHMDSKEGIHAHQKGWRIDAREDAACIPLYETSGHQRGWLMDIMRTPQGRWHTNTIGSDTWKTRELTSGPHSDNGSSTRWLWQVSTRAACHNKSQSESAPRLPQKRPECQNHCYYTTGATAP